MLTRFGFVSFGLAVVLLGSGNNFLPVAGADCTTLFGVDVLYGAGDEPVSVAIGDLDGDGDADLAVTNTFDDNVSVLLNQTPCPCEGDANGDGLVDPLDSGFVLARFGCSVGTGDDGCDAADQNGDGAVDPLDSGFVLARFGDCP